MGFFIIERARPFPFCKGHFGKLETFEGAPRPIPGVDYTEELGLVLT